MTRNRKIIRHWKKMILRRLFYENDNKARLELIDALRVLELWDQGLITETKANALAEVRSFQDVLFDWWFRGNSLAASRRRPSLD